LEIKLEFYPFKKIEYHQSKN